MTYFPFLVAAVKLELWGTHRTLPVERTVLKQALCPNKASFFVKRIHDWGHGPLPAGYFPAVM